MHVYMRKLQVFRNRKDPIAFVLTLAKQIVFQNTIDGTKSIFPAYFFTFKISSAIIGNPYFINTYLRNSSQFSSYFRFKSKPFFLQFNVLNYLCFAKLITGFHICKVKISKHIAHSGQNLIPDGMPVKQNSVRVTTQKS